ncbi:cytochrome C oxidase subunit IV family protein [Aureibaculum sp. 2210JD6-5]|uniref:cytochrome C oxidase subunit IV family protein n=1 Tax=Aureibaculum sp. 2210JD6-5 TaxID=3103957 RepID=UPI002AAE9415|nr:cytochrome C oxidase subunit IV family protein [Aureibaculum sp. 2210JD6-5]MDY7396232.1 cytochrome C oxidase subunit IV family protein [Aureibaculum sp. 2210JD6-5]
MAQDQEHEHESHVGLIWKVFGFLSLVTIVEVALGIIKPKSLHLGIFLGTSWLNWIFLILTLVKAYGIAWYFMHLKYEKTGLRRAIVWTTVFLICYLAALILIEGDYIADIMSDYTRWSY